MKVSRKDLTKNPHRIVGSAYNLSLLAQATMVDVLVKRDNPNDTPLITGQFVLLLSQYAGSELSFLGRVEDLRPDLNEDLNYKESLKRSRSTKRGMDDIYLEGTLDINYKIRVLGACEEKDKEIIFYSNVRALPSVDSLLVAIPSSDFMTKLFQSAVKKNDNESGSAIFQIGTLKYGTLPEYTSKYYEADQEIPVQFNAGNLLRKRTAIFGKSGYGKSNTVKTVIGMMATKFPNCGQLIIDTNGEYALENDQNDGFMDIFHEAGVKDKCVLYTARKIHASKKEKLGENSFKSLRFDVFENVTSCIKIILSNLTLDSVPMYLQSWKTEVENEDDQTKLFTNAKNRGLVWGIWFKTCMNAGLTPVNQIAVNSPELQISKRFLDEYVTGLNTQDGDEDSAIEDSDEIPENKFIKLPEIRQAEILNDLGARREHNRYYTRNVHTMADYADWYVDNLRQKEKKKKDGESSRDSSEDSSIKGYSELLQYARRLYQLKAFNIGELPADQRKGAKPISLGESVWQDLRKKKIVIIDIASISIDVAKALILQIVGFMLAKASELFGDSEKREEFKDLDILVFIEEAQNYLSTEQIRDGGIYERLAKEGRKFHLGLVYITQQPSVIDPKITSQTENIIAMHMSNSRDTMMLHDIKDKFDELTCKFLKDEAQVGLAYLYAEPHQPFVLPAKIFPFNKQLILEGLKKKK